ncbi:GH25 family lysozyme [Clostridium sp.]|uniref:GH25 family lysozyme n=1 Tax=Clostridium sp. TaxID=1506 RepID=UPI00284DD811|nr:GH25 family lysozyme [Clostridium sp.]MDR3598526.1 GH25 family lysozyme [Clostridium sp.]
MSYIKGIDISNNDGSVDFSSVAANGVGYVYVKATEGQSFQDSTMVPFYNECKNNGLKVGAYHFLVGTSTPESQAQNFYETIKDYSWDLVPMVDVETNFDGLTDYLSRFIDTFNQLSPLTLGIYSYTSFMSNIESISDKISGMPFWEANYNNDPWNLPSNFFTDRIGHQYTESGSISGINTGCDVDSFTEGVLITVTSTLGEWQEGTGDNAGKWWYKHSDGSYTKNGWEQIDGKWYLFDSNGWMLYDWKQDGNTWYFLGNANDGSMKTGWQLINGKWYYFNTSGAMQTGWVQVNNNWYYFDVNGSMCTGWIVVNGKNYCLYSDGSMIHDTTAYGYSFDNNGVAAKIQ